MPDSGVSGSRGKQGFCAGLILFGLISVGSTWDDGVWQLKVDKQGIKIYIAPVEGSPINTFRAVSVYEGVTLTEMVGMILDMDHFTEWIDGAIEARVVKKLSEAEQACYYVNAVPLLRDRDAVIVQRVTQNPETLVVTIELSSMPDLVPRSRKYIRVEHLVGSWRLEPLGDGRVELTYQVHLDPAGFIPAWIVNSIVVNAPYNTLRNLHQALPLSRYDELTLSYIREAR